MVDDMRKVIFTIDDLEYFKRSNNLTEEQLQDICHKVMILRQKM